MTTSKKTESDKRHLRVVLWDVRTGGDTKLPLIERIDADIVLLLAVSTSSGERWQRRWDTTHHCAVGLEHHPATQARPHGAMIRSRWPLSDVFVQEEMQHPERALHARVHTPYGPIRLISWGAPHAGRDRGVAKMAAYSAMQHHLVDVTEPVILGVDTNSWFDPPLPGPRDVDEFWAPEHGFLDRDPDHGLVDVHRHLMDQDEDRRRLLSDLRPHGPLAVTFIRRPRGEPRRLSGAIEQGSSWGLDRMDRLFTSPRFTPLACEHLYHEALEHRGDHALLVADLRWDETDRS